jgi:quinol monooxygenase YgiN
VAHAAAISSVETEGEEMTAAPQLTLSLVAKLVAKNETAEEVAAFLTAAVELANDEPGTIVWSALRTDETTFWIVDAFPSEAERQAHLDGPIAAALMSNAERLLAEPPEILPASILSVKVP